jgi:hypothetical protein
MAPVCKICSEVWSAHERNRHGTFKQVLNMLLRRAARNKKCLYWCINRLVTGGYLGCRIGCSTTNPPRLCATKTSGRRFCHSSQPACFADYLQMTYIVWATSTTALCDIFDLHRIQRPPMSACCGLDPTGRQGC